MIDTENYKATVGLNTVNPTHKVGATKNKKQNHRLIAIYEMYGIQ